jgi:hypothetical protein
VQRTDDQLVVATPGGDYLIDAGPHTVAVEAVLRLLDGHHRPADLADRLAEHDVRSLLNALDERHLLAEPGPATARPAIAVLLEIEDLTNDLLHRTLYRNEYWKAVHQGTDGVPLNVLYGTAIENYHFLFRESWFDAPVLPYPYSRSARVLVNEFYAEEIGHDELILRSLEHLGISRDDLARTMPLATTVALCNALSYWARYDPLFFLTTIGTLEGKDIDTDSYLEACERAALPPEFVRPLRAHSEINLRGGHGNLTRAIFAGLGSGIDDLTTARLRAQTQLFVELYDAFYSGIWDYYSQPGNPLVRSITTTEG